MSEGKKISVWVVDPGKRPRHVNISNTLENLQKHVGGYIDYIKLASNFGIICNEEGIPLGLPYNVEICSHRFFGTLILVGQSDTEFDHCPVDSVKQLRALFPQLYEGRFS